MNIFKTVYCRAFQSAFKIAMPVLPYRKPTLLSSVKEIPGILSQKKKNKVLIITDKSIRKTGIIKPLEKALIKNHISYKIYDKTVANPTVSNVEEALRIYRKYSLEAIIGFGGGSSMDCAKACGARIANPRKTLQDMEGILRVFHRTPLIIAVPTTAGTGSETTLASVIVDDETRHKFTINDFPLIPSYAVLDPEVTRGLPQFYTATTGMDALTHAIEAYIGHTTTEETRDWSIKAVKLIFKHLEEAYKDGNNMKARKAMLYASYLAGASFTRSYVGYCHAVAHTLGGKYNIPHGQANAVLLPYVLRAYGPSIHHRLKRLAVETGVVYKDTPNAVAAEIFIRKIEGMNRRMKIGKRLKGIRIEDIANLAKRAEHEANPLYPVPKLMEAHELEAFYVDVIEDKEVKHAKRRHS